MAKGFKLKELLSHEKEQQKIDKEDAIKLSKQKEAEKNATVKVISSKDLEEANEKEAADAAAAASAAAEKASKDEEGEEYKSEALSKKDQRKAKKQAKKQESRLEIERLAESESESEIENDVESEKEEEEEEDVPLSDVEFDSDADIVPYQKVTINNVKALNQALDNVQLPWGKHSFQEHQSVISEENTDAKIKDIYDDTERELAFYKQSLGAVVHARDELKRLKVPFLRPLDYFAEMVKNDEHMDKIKSELVRDASEKKARQEARRQRDLKKFGKQVQVATLQKRQLEKKDSLDKIKNLKKKRKQNEITGDDFNVAVEEETESRAEKYGRPNSKRSAKNSKYGQGGLKRFKRKNDAESSADISGFSQRRMKGKPARPGKSRRSRRH
ncbi:similar to Saccharomyces cerevisiae YKL172W EBP2 Required for 25S rRNA maturation and 60S ribosomal subunit assembly [Maudiozyma barnettii]|uniref:Similar to Saccharomyces cerevisiae YKL172W EBP2 Required for 25S rRNA maturation and 60S ribosomal subunit assembly n=1 Tax=Maudiozyma barnettii TaxID=61262 RepID=A0A8H2ZI60_9SACH|nr:Ebp2p [Kazachstania barnettii]CAB4254628.1 similar to Saccharomyces cerevisiae YKL172W EBP2 Required for 25S rRNA maturation and 60S ribosomal subunit assembly [Kazachstania barnettii]CAD1782670.1 similar to Saccharomyces cerevisiae YKL172W EBP2 Required for 25S rRNA maturation and 60S ribosomal subunit assembly [Kazachstania barnettii]